jgi:hypothetical protein
MRYPFEGSTRVAIVPAVDNLALPTMAEIAAGEDVTCDLTRDGLRVGKSEETEDRTPWRGPLTVEQPTRYSIDAQLTAYRGDEVVWDLAAYGEQAVLIVRRGVPYETPLQAGDVVETYQFVWGKRSPAPAASNTAQTFTVRLYVNEDADTAVVAA